MTIALVQYLSRNGLRLLFLASGLCIGVGMLWQGQSISERLGDLFIGVGASAVAYAFFYLYLNVLVTAGERFFGRWAFWYTASVLYAGIGGGLLSLIVLPFDWQGPDVRGLTGPEFLALIPSSIAASLAAARVIEKHYVVV